MLGLEGLMLSDDGRWARAPGHSIATGVIVRVAR
jgi:hypothetical protein